MFNPPIKSQFSKLTFYTVLQPSEKQQYIFSLQRKLLKIKTDNISGSFYHTSFLSLGRTFNVAPSIDSIIHSQPSGIFPSSVAIADHITP